LQIAELLKREKPFISLEFFPPQEQAKWPSFFESVHKLRALNPLFVSVTYGALGKTRQHTLEIVSRLRNEYGLETMAHLTCVGASAQNVSSFLKDLVSAGIDNVLALRGDPPEGTGTFKPDNEDFRNASDLVAFIRRHYPEFCIGVAAYPEGHPEAPCFEEDLKFLKSKFDRGADFAITQLFFDNDHYWDFTRRAREIGIDKPIIPGIMPIYNLGTVQRILGLCGATIPKDYLDRLKKEQERDGTRGVQALGLKYARDQISELMKAGAPGVHLYTLNKAGPCLNLISGLDMETG
jgi:methylenetetrahydrofolate reductase (NADPH)